MSFGAYDGQMRVPIKRNIMQEATFELSDLWTVFRRRKWPFALTTLLLIAVGVGLALFLPPVYLSEATILIEEPDVPRDLVSSTVFADGDKVYRFEYEVSPTTGETWWYVAELTSQNVRSN